ncbi:cell division protein ZapA [Aquicoccus porphyridii]|uniref:Cell division protein ZapA n=1 Tax=Aquicoccus porphyridii TaxID=1852029 RepID=A0A5A9ZH65_9RHOB|nr:cell division protein ZapA [Aquicoccus porphyridii]KAA0916603.1 cell division protein ZapA [Aquicoccus porphyridii]RAI53737.1 cell division protein ZapA [Rhodobacteraceae bacterium AsT-22]
MPEVEIMIGGRAFEVACQEGEEHYLRAAAAMLDAEASVLTEQIGRLPEARMLLMAGLMLADKTAGVEDKLKVMQGQVQELEAELERLRNTPAPEPERVEVPMVPESVTETMAELAARAEALAAEVEEKLGAEG